MTRETYRFLAKWFLIIDGCFLVLATAAVFLPEDWMAATHQWLGLGEFQRSPILIYLARSTSMLYAVHGAILIALGRNLETAWGIAKLVAILHILMGVGLFVTDWQAGLPLYWIAGEGLPIASSGVLLWFLLARSEFGDDSEKTS